MVKALCIHHDLLYCVRLLDSSEGVVFGKLKLVPDVQLISTHHCLAMHEDEYWEGVIKVTGEFGSSLDNDIDLK